MHGIKFSATNERHASEQEPVLTLKAVRKACHMRQPIQSSFHLRDTSCFTRSRVYLSEGCPVTSASQFVLGTRLLPLLEVISVSIEP